MYILDNFYSNPISIRESALSKNFCITGNFEGVRTEYSGENSEIIKSAFENILSKQIVYWPEGYNTAYQYTTETCNTWVHWDQTMWAGIIYLTPNAPKESGTGIYRHSKTGYYKHSSTNTVDFNSTYAPQEEWELILKADNIFNRLILYKGSYYHRSILPGFGKDKESARLFQVFFFDTN